MIFRKSINSKNILRTVQKCLEDRKISPKVMFIIMGIASTVWFLLRVLPKPSRASYPCVRASAPMMSGFVIYLLSLGGISVALKKSVTSLVKARYIAAGSLFGLALLFSIVSLLNDFSFSAAQVAETSKGPSEQPNQPFGKSTGINPGLVVWAWNPDATNENCRNVIENADWFINPVNANQEIIGKMVSKGVMKIAGKNDLKGSWDGIFRYHNQKKHKTDKGYTPGEKIFIKINQGTASWVISKEQRDAGYFFPTSLKPGQDRYSKSLGTTETSPFVVLEILRELVYNAGVNQKDIIVGDPIAHIFGHNYVIWHGEFPDVIYIDRTSDKFGRTLIKPTEKELLFYSDKKLKDKLYDVIETADYLINVASLKPHGSAGISLTAKNHFGSQARTSASHLHYSLIAPSWEKSPRETGNPNNGGYGKYRVLVDLMGSSYLGQNTMLYIVDGLFGGGSDETKGPVKYYMAPFNNDWSSSIWMSQDQVALESVCYDFLRSEWDGTHKHSAANNVMEDGPNMPGVDDYMHQAADSKYWPEGIIYDPDNSGKSLPSLGVHEHWNNPDEKQYYGNLGNNGGITLVSIPDTLVKRKN